MKITILGGTRLARKLQAASASGPPALVGALFQEAERIMTASKQDYVPVQTGALRASGFVDEPVLTATGGSVTLGFGGPAAPYAVIVHEDLTKRHPVGQAKYLEVPLRAAIQGMAGVLKQRVGDAIRQAFQRQTKIEQNLSAGRDVNFGMPLFR